MPALALAAGAAAAAGALAVVAAALVRGRRREPSLADRPPHDPDDGRDRALADYWEPNTPDPRGRRQTFRRGGPPTPVVCTAAAARPQPGWVLDRSAAGLRLAVGRPAEPGAVLRVVPRGAPAVTRAVAVEVRWCRRAKDHYQLGCRFPEAPPPDVLVLFG